MISKLRAFTPAIILGAVLAPVLSEAGTPSVGTIPLDLSKVVNTSTDLADRMKIALGEKAGRFLYAVPFQSESNVGGTTVAGRNAAIVSCSPAAVWMLLQSTDKLTSGTTFASFITQAATDRDPTWGWTHEGYRKAAEKYGITLEVNDYGDPTQYSKDGAWLELMNDVSRGPVALSIQQIDPSTKAAETKNTHMIVLRGVQSDGQGEVTFIVNDPIAKSEVTPRNPSSTQARDHRVGVTTWPDDFVKESSLDRWLTLDQ